ncbi:[protein-PII] uridylyltransferase [Hamadaea tsunoensis]|uniref:[protein-PII] uridylyltransferase n=1 Tax=Hamadaea tsunoensis TaxID=53368 RepID=UPI000413C8CC|nr:[protein-PII] uridylyltransferase [Hamadaea tsunoensis]
MNIADIGAAAREQRAAAFDVWLARLAADAHLPAGAALVAVGGLGRRECAPGGDLDLVLVHSGLAGIDDVAAAIWYPIWDSRTGLDHSVRTVAESLDAAVDDAKVALGLLDARHVAGDAQVSAKLIRSAADVWRRTAAQQLSRLRELTQTRHALHGALTQLLEGDLKESAGGLRDVAVLRGIGRAGIADATPPRVRAAQLRLLDVRDALHLAAGRKLDRLVAHERQAVAEALGLADGDALLRRVANDAATIEWTLDDAWRSVHRWRAHLRRGGVPLRPKRMPLAADVVEDDGEVVLARSAVTPRPDPSLSVRVAAAAAAAKLPIARSTLEWLSRHVPPLPDPWPAAARTAFVSLLGTGPALVPTWTACDRFGLITQWLPEWARLRGAPQHNAVHQFTLDRHLVSAAAEAGGYTREVARPDLLLISALVHDIGKGLPGDHSEVGAPLAAAVARRIGLPPADVDVIERAVRRHLLIPDVATRRDLGDPETVAAVAEAVGDSTTLEVLHMLARADASATGPAAWSSWKSRLIDQLATAVSAVLQGAPPPPPLPPDPALVTAELPVVQVAPDWVAVAAADRAGLLATVAGCLTGHQLEVVAVNSITVEDRAILQCAVQPRFGAEVSRDSLAADLRRAALGQLVLSPRLGRTGLRTKPGAVRPSPRLLWPAEDLLEVRATDAPALLYRITSALAETGVNIRAARVSTLGADVVDAFYLIGPVDRPAVEKAVLAALG